MDKKKIIRTLTHDDLKGFEEFLEHTDTHAVVDKNQQKNAGGENLTFLMNENIRLQKISTMTAEKMPIIKQFSQGKLLIERQSKINGGLKNELCKMLTPVESPLHLGLGSIWDGFFNS